MNAYTKMTVKCPSCKRDVAFNSSAEFVTHGPGRGGAFLCPMSGQKVHQPDKRKRYPAHRVKGGAK